MKHNLTLYHYWRSSCSWRVRWALEIKKQSYQAVPVNLLKGEQNSPEYLKKNPLGFVPCLVVDQTSLGESLAILEWIEETYPNPPLLPSDSLSRAKVRQLCNIIVAGTQPLQNLSVQKYYCPDETKRMEDGRYWIKRGLSSFEKILESSSGTYCVGDTLTMADLCLIPQCYNALRYELNLDLFPRAKTIYEFCRTLPECKKAEPVNPEA